jgi:hypothetical protein
MTQRSPQEAKMDDTLIIILIILAVLFLCGWWYRSRGGRWF